MACSHTKKRFHIKGNIDPNMNEMLVMPFNGTVTFSRVVVLNFKLFIPIKGKFIGVIAKHGYQASFV